MIDDFINIIKFLIKGYHKHKTNPRFSRVNERIKSGNSKINDRYSKIMNWIKQEIKK